MKKVLFFIPVLLIAFAIQAQQQSYNMNAASIADDGESMDEMESQQLDDEEYVDLGLPSGTKWPRSHYTVICYDDDIPDNTATLEQWEELRKNCSWKFRRNKSISSRDDDEVAGDYEITGPNGNKIWIKNIGPKCNGCSYEEAKLYKESVGSFSAYDYIGRWQRTSNNDAIIFVCKPENGEWKYVAIRVGNGWFFYPDYENYSSGIKWGYIKVDSTTSYLDGSPCGKRRGVESLRLITVSK